MAATFACTAEELAREALKPVSVPLPVVSAEVSAVQRVFKHVSPSSAAFTGDGGSLYDESGKEVFVVNRKKMSSYRWVQTPSGEPVVGKKRTKLLSVHDEMCIVTPDEEKVLATLRFHKLFQRRGSVDMYLGARDTEEPDYTIASSKSDKNRFAVAHTQTGETVAVAHSEKFKSKEHANGMLFTLYIAPKADVAFVFAVILTTIDIFAANNDANTVGALAGAGVI